MHHPRRLAPLALAAAAFGLAAPLAIAQDPGARDPRAETTNVSGGPLRAGRACYDVQKYLLYLTVDPEAQTIEGVCRMMAIATENADTFELDLDPALEVRKVEFRDKATGFRREGGVITVEPHTGLRAGRGFEVAVHYGGTPRTAPSPPWKGGFTWAETPDGAPWIATSCQGEGADLWWPCKDHPSDEAAAMDLFVTVPKGLFVASNGTLQRRQEKDGGLEMFHWHVANPINNYGVALNIAPYVEVRRSYTSVAGETMPVQFWVLPGNEEKAEKVIDEFVDHIRVMEQLCGPYPFRNEKFGIAETPHLGMEHQTILAYGYRFRRHRLDYDWLQQHEMSHEWWGNLVTCRDWKDMWIHEGIGTYMQALYLEHSTFSERGRGRDAYRNTMLESYRQIANQRPLAPRETTDSQAIYFGGGGGDIYSKGAWVCHSLRWLLGDETFFEVLRRWAYPDPAMEKVTDGSQTRITDSEELIAIAEKVSGRELDWFFEIYLRRAGIPELKAEERDGTLHLEWVTPDDLPFPMPFGVEVDGEVVRVEPEGKKGQLDLGGKAYRLDQLHVLRVKG